MVLVEEYFRLSGVCDEMSTLLPLESNISSDIVVTDRLIKLK